MPVEFAAIESPESEPSFAQDEYQYGGRERFAIAYGAWQTMYGSTGAG
jgi:phage major head subunit gpT-like protein